VVTAAVEALPVAVVMVPIVCRRCQRLCRARCVRMFEKDNHRKHSNSLNKPANCFTFRNSDSNLPVCWVSIYLLLRAFVCIFFVFPSTTTTTTLQVLEVEVQKVTHELRRRCAFLRHLPLGVHVSFVELEVGRALQHKYRWAFVSSSILRAISALLYFEHRRMHSLKFFSIFSGHFEIVYP